MDLIARIVNSVSQKGLTRSVQSVISVMEDHYFDRKYGIDTLDICEIDRQHSFGYQPTRLRHFKKLMRELKFPKDSVFVDMGSGKGKVLLMATQYGFKRVKGVEISKELCEIARSNVLSFEKKAGRALPVEVIESDVLQYRIEDDDNVFYLFKPFDGVIMKQLVEGIKTSLQRTPRKVWLVFNNFKYHDLLSGEEIFQRKLEYAYGGTEFVVYESGL